MAGFRCSNGVGRKLCLSPFHVCFSLWGFILKQTRPHLCVCVSGKVATSSFHMHPPNSLTQDRKTSFSYSSSKSPREDFLALSQTSHLGRGLKDQAESQGTPGGLHLSACPSPAASALPNHGGDPPTAHEGTAGLLRPLGGGHPRADRAGEWGQGWGTRVEMLTRRSLALPSDTPHPLCPGSRGV